MSMDFSGANPQGQGGVGELIPDGTLAWGVIAVRPHNLDQGLVLVPSKSSDGKYLDIEITITDGQHARRKVFHKIGLAGSEKWVAQGFAAIRHILEVGRRIQNYAPGEPAYQLGPSTQTNGEVIFMELDQMQCAIKVGIEPGKDGYADKNTVRAFLSPNPDSNTNKDWQRLLAGDTAPKTAAKAAPPAAAWGGSQAPQTTQKMPAGNAGGWAAPGPQAAQNRAPAGRPAWAGPAPDANKAPF